MSGHKRQPMKVNLVESAGEDAEGVARILRTWAILLADQAERRVAPAKTDSHTGAQGDIT